MKRIFYILLAMCLCLAGCGGEPAGKKDMSFFYNGTEITMHAPAEPVLTALGEAKAYTETASCAFEGLDKTYFYGSFYLSTYPGEDGDRISGLWFADDTVTTPEGITIGSGRSQVAQAYGEFQGDAALILAEEVRLTILLEGNTVTGVRYDAVMP